MEKEYPQYARAQVSAALASWRKPAPCLAPDEVALLFVAGTNAYSMVLVEARPKVGGLWQRVGDL